MFLSSLKKWFCRGIRKVVPAVPAPVAAPVRRKRRKGATAMEYVVVASFILVVLIVGVNAVGGVTKTLFNTSKDAITKSK